MTVSTDYSHLNNAVTGGTHLQNKKLAQAGQSADLYAEFSAMLDKIAFHLSSQAEFSESTQVPKELETKAKEIQKLKEKEVAEPTQKAEKPKEDCCHRPEQEPSESEAKKTEQATEEEVEQVEQVKAVEQETEAGEAQAAADTDETEEVADDESLDTEDDAQMSEEEVAEELVEQLVDQVTEQVVKSDAVVQAAHTNHGKTKETKLDEQAPQEAEEVIVDAQTNNQQRFEDASRGVGKHVSEIAREELKPLKEKIEISLEKPQQEVQVPANQTGQSEDKPFGDLVEQMARSLLGKIQNKQTDEMQALATEKIMLDVNANLRPVIDATSDIRSTLLSATMIKHLVEGGIQQQTDVAAFKGVQASSGQQAVQASIATQQRDQSSTQNGEAQASASKRLPKTLENRTLKRVEDALKEVAKSRDGKTISVRLDPPHLGSVKIDVSIKEGALHARFVAESQAVTSLLREKGVEIQNMLRKLGLEVSDVSVSIGYEGSEQGFSDTSDLNQGHNQGQQSHDVLGEMLVGGTSQVNAAAQNSTAVEDHWIA
ncbi:MAG: flagellar hook-length control protein FliK [Bdellovibrionales bacterium]|nr:flagellar hook-length control protein FliK [Bdellovibrionales bacterium]